MKAKAIAILLAMSFILTGLTMLVPNVSAADTTYYLRAETGIDPPNKNLSVIPGSAESTVDMQIISTGTYNIGTWTTPILDGGSPTDIGGTWTFHLYIENGGPASWTVNASVKSSDDMSTDLSTPAIKLLDGIGKQTYQWVSTITGTIPAGEWAVIDFWLVVDTVPTQYTYADTAGEMDITTGYSDFPTTPGPATAEINATAATENIIEGVDGAGTQANMGVGNDAVYNTFTETADAAGGGWSNVFTEAFASVWGSWPGSATLPAPANEYWAVPNSGSDANDVSIGNFGTPATQLCIEIRDSDSTSTIEALDAGGAYFNPSGSGWTDGYINYSSSLVLDNGQSAFFDVWRQGTGWVNIPALTIGPAPGNGWVVDWTPYSYQLVAADLASTQLSWRYWNDGTGNDDRVSIDDITLDALTPGASTYNKLDVNWTYDLTGYQDSSGIYADISWSGGDDTLDIDWSNGDDGGWVWNNIATLPVGGQNVNTLYSIPDSQINYDDDVYIRVRHAEGTGTDEQTVQIDQLYFNVSTGNSDTFSVTEEDAGGGLGPDFSIQRGYTIMASGQLTTTITAPANFIAPASSNAFVRIVNTRLTGMGKTSGGGIQNSILYTTWIKDPWNLTKPSVNSITFERGASSADNRISWEIIEYIGPVAGPNEMIVRNASVTQTGTGGGASCSTNVIPGIVDHNDVVPFITGQLNFENSASNAHMGLFTALWNSGSSTATFTAGAGTTTNTGVSCAIVEFTGSNWGVQRVENIFAGNSAESQTITPFGSTSRAFIHSQHRADDGLLERDGHRVWLSGTDQINFQVNATANFNGIAAVAWVIRNSDTGPGAMNVQHYSDWRPGDVAFNGEWTWSVSITSVTDMAQTSIMSECAGSAYNGAFTPYGSVTLQLIANNQVQLKTSCGFMDLASDFDVVEWPQSSSGAGYDLDVEINVTSVPAGGAHQLQYSIDTVAGDAETIDVQLWDGAWNSIGTAASSTTLTKWLTTNEYNSGNVRTRLVDSSDDGSNTTIEIEHVRVETFSNLTLYYDGAAAGGSDSWIKCPGGADPSVASTTPSNGASGVLEGASVVVVFDMAMNTGVTPTLTQTAGSDPGGWSGPVWSVGDTTATWTHSNWNSEDSVTMEVDGAQNAGGDPMAAPYSWSFTVRDYIDPTITGETPSSGATGVNEGQNIVVVFSEAMNTGVAPTLTQTAGADPGGWSFVGWTGGDTATWAHNNWNSEIGVTMQVGTNAEDANGRTMAAPYSWSFTVRDYVAPTVSSTTPANGAPNVATSANVVVVFDEAMNTGVTPTLAQTAGTDPGGWSGPVWSVGDTTATWTHAAWTNGDSVTMQVSAAQDDSGNPLAAPYSWSFTIIAVPDTWGPSVIATVPANAASDVGLGVSVEITFNETMNTGVTPTLTQTAGTDPGGWSGPVWSVGDTVATWTHADWTGSEGITMQVDNGQDVIGNPMPAPYSWSFTTTVGDSPISVHMETRWTMFSLSVFNTTDEVNASEVATWVTAAGGSSPVLSWWEAGVGYHSYTGIPGDDFELEVGKGYWIYLDEGPGAVDITFYGLTRADFETWDLANGDSSPLGDGTADGKLSVTLTPGDDNLLGWFNTTSPVVGEFITLIDDGYDLGVRGFVLYWDNGLREYSNGALQLAPGTITTESWPVEPETGYYTAISTATSVTY